MSIRAKLIALLILIAGSTSTALAQVRPGQPQGPGFQQNRNQQKANPDDAAALAGGVMCVVGVSILIGIAIKIAIILFIVSDAKKRGMDPTMWVILEIFVGLVGLIVYLCVREPLLSEKRRRRMREDDEYDRPRRSRRARDDDDNDYDRPRRSRRDRDDDDDYDQPRRSRSRQEDPNKNPFDFN